MFLCDNRGNFEHLQYFNFTASFLKNESLFWKTGVPFESTSAESAAFPYKLSCQKPILRQIECGVQNEPSTKNVVVPLNTILFFKIE